MQILLEQPNFISQADITVVRAVPKPIKLE